ncbi:hypothetical protein OESDEN_16708 [Oesophagostomum dentatum]|uniref:Uncharacterized protein n=1 Tax=Oesophagostomum dentatum TaxID=61180 RepID=A0A0B1SI81_OESDE|nr:hypothetical protein OESDEN_16708 [Oesophagostomum dentatum]
MQRILSGQFISTLFLAFYPINAKQGLVIDSWLLVVGSLVSLVPRVLSSITIIDDTGYEELSLILRFPLQKIALAPLPLVLPSF